MKQIYDTALHRCDVIQTMNVMSRTLRKLLSIIIYNY